MLVITMLLAILLIKYSLQVEAEQRILEYKDYTAVQMLENVTFSGNDGLLQEIKLFDNGDGYSVFLPTEMKNDSRIYFESFATLIIQGNEEYHNGDSLHDLEDDIPYDVQIIGWDERTFYTTRLTFFHANSIPTMYIRTENGTTEEIDKSKEIKIDAYLMTIKTDGIKDVENKCTIKTRGMSSFAVEQKSYNIKTNREISPFGMDAAKEWALLANWYDSVQQLRNKMTFDLAQSIGLEYTLDSCFVNLYIDGEYRGLYLLVERPTIDGGSVHIDDMQAEHENNDGIADNITGGYLFEESARYDLESYYFPVEIGNPIVIKNPSTVTEEEFAYISTYIQAAARVLADDVTIEQMQQYFDLDSWIRMYLIQEFAVQTDVEFDSFKFYKKRNDPLIYAGPVWDFDYAYGHAWIGNFLQLSQRTIYLQDGHGVWLEEFGENSIFMERVIRLYQEEFLPLVEAYISSELLHIAEENRASITMNSRRWNRYIDAYDNEIYQLYNWTSGRGQFLQNYWSSPDDYCKVTFHIDAYSYSYYIKSGEALNYLPMIEYGEDDHKRFGTVIEWITDTGDAVDVTVPVTEDMTLTALYK